MIRTAVLASLLVAAARLASAQQTPSDVMSFLVTNQSVQTGDFQKDQAAADATRDTISRAILVNLAAVPIAISSSGFAYRLDPELGTVRRVSDTFGTFFVERAATSGEGRTTFGVSVSAASYDRLDGLQLDDGSLVTTANRFRDESSAFDTESLTLRVSTKTMTVFGSYGVTDRLEVGGALPLVQLHVEGSRLNVYRGQSLVQATGSANASGIADAAVRVKYRLTNSAAGGFALAGELRLPTGDSAALLGAGRASLRVMAIGSAERGLVGLHGNASLVRGGASSEIGGSGAVSVAPSPRVTVSAELLMRRLNDLHAITPAAFPHPSIAGVDTLRLVPAEGGSLLANAVTGVKWNPHATVVVTGQLWWRLRNAGLTARVTPTFAIDYLF